MAAKNVLGIIFSNSFDEAIPQLTSLRTMGSVPFGGRYRLIDFTLSDMVNAGIPQVGVICNNNYRSLMTHIGNGKDWDLSRKREGLNLLPPFSLPESGACKGKVDALYNYISYIGESGKEYVALTDCNAICSVNYSELLKFTTSNNADITLCYCKGLPAKLAGATEICVDEGGSVTGLSLIDNFEKETAFLTKTMLIKRTLLERLLHEAHSQGIGDIEALLISNLPHIKAYGFEQKGYVKVVDSLQSYFDASLDLLNKENRKLLFNSDRPVYTKTGDNVPTFYGVSSSVKNSLIADGCIIEGEVENCILFRGVTVAKGAKVKNSILMKGTYVGEGCALSCVITDKSVVFKQNKTLSGDLNYPLYIGKGIII